MKNFTYAFGFLLFIVGSPAQANADSFGTTESAFEIEFVTIDNPNNSPDEIGDLLGSVDNIYRIAKYEISREMVEKANALGELEIELSDMDGIDGGPRPKMPATGVSWNEAARFVNWLNISSGSSPAYKFKTQPGGFGYSSNANIVPWNSSDDGFDTVNPFRNSRANYFLPSVHEWYKAAFYDPSISGYWYFATGSNTPPRAVASGTETTTAVYDQPQQQGPADITQAGGLSSYGVMGMAGNVFEWQETTFEFLNQFPGYDRWQSGSSWNFSTARSSGNDNPDGSDSTVGFRVASIPEQTLTTLMAGDADQDLDFDQLDLVRVQVTGKYLTGGQATWGDGDWNGAPGGSPGNPPEGDGLFDQFDIIAANVAEVYLQGPYSAIQTGGAIGDGQTSLVYHAGTGELSVDAPAGQELTSINVTSASGRFIGKKPAVLDGAFDNFATDNVFKATFGGSFGSISFGNVLPVGIAQSDLAADVSAVGSLAGGGDLGEVDLVYVPEPVSMLLLSVGLAIGLVHFRRVYR